MLRNNAVGCGTCADTCELRVCLSTICPHIDHRIELGLVTYREAVLSIIPNTPRLLPRLEDSFNRISVISGLLLNARIGWTA